MIGWVIMILIGVGGILYELGSRAEKKPEEKKPDGQPQA